MIKQLTSEFSLQFNNIKSLISLHEEGNTVPFIARYRKEVTGNMDEIIIREIIERHEYLLNLKKRKIDIIAIIEEKGKLTEELQKSILAASTLKIAEDLYAPYKSKRKTKADIAKEAGLDPLALWIRQASDIDNINDEAGKYLNETVADVDMAVNMAMDIIIEEVGHNVDIKNRVRDLLRAKGEFISEKKKDVKERTAFEDYYEFAEAVTKIPPHRILALFRGEKEDILKIKIAADNDLLIAAAEAIAQGQEFVLNDVIRKCIKSAFKRMLQPSLELELRNELKEVAEKQAIDVFAENLKNLLMTPPVKNRRFLGIDPAFRTGCKYAVLDETGKLLDYGVIYPTAPKNDVVGAGKIIVELVAKHNIDSIAIGNGTASREVEEFVDKLINEKNLDVSYTIVSEAGASVYSASEIAAKEFPDLDLTIRGAISIARRVIDPLAELVKIDPKAIGVGMYQHDVNQKELKQTLGNTVEGVVNSVGVDVNTASASLLQFVAGLTASSAGKIVKYRESSGRFENRKEILNVTGVGEQAFQQCAGFLKIYDGDEPLDQMFIHPENYNSVYRLLKEIKVSAANSHMIRLALKNIKIKDLANKFQIGEFTINDIFENLEKPGLDIRDSVDPVIFRKGVLSLDDLEEGMVLDGKITNVLDFGAFVDIGLKNDGLVHISQLANKYVKHPSDVVSVGQNVSVKVLSIDTNRGRLSLSMK